jgi:hypothetical protein
MCFAFEGATDIGDAGHTYKTVYFIIMSRRHFKKLVEKYNDSIWWKINGDKRRASTISLTSE